MDHSSDTIALVAFGANLPSHVGSPKATIQDAFASMARLIPETVETSRFFRTPAFPAGAGPDYVNAVARLRWNGPALPLLELLHGIENSFGRVRDQRWGPRILDLDLLALGDLVLPNPATETYWRELSADRAAQETPEELILPHPRLSERAFVLVPLADVAPDWVHPVTGLSVAQMCAALPAVDRDAIVPI